MFDLHNKVALITGASGGIGSEIAKVFAQNGANIVVNDINEEKGLKFADELKKMGSKAMFIKADVSNFKEVDAMTDRIIDEYGKIDILVNNAGINISFEKRTNIDQFSNEEWKKIMEVDLNGVYYCSKSTLKHMIKQRYGKIINICSVVSVVPLRQQCAFVAAKSGVAGLTKSTAIEVGEYGINVNGIVPGSILIEGMIGLVADGRKESIISHIPMNRQGTPADIPSAALYLASDEANYVTGNILVVDGGWSCGYNLKW